MSSRRRPYLNLKQSILDLFRTPAHWLKEFSGKWSIFEKPYLDGDYRAMHLRWSAPRWPRIPDTAPRGIFPERPGTWTFLWEPGICNLGVINANCGETFRLSVSIGLLPLHEPGTGINFHVQSSEPDKVKILSIGDSDSNVVYGEAGQFSVMITGEIVDDWTGTATVCVQASLGGGRILVGFQVLNPYGDGPGILRFEQALQLPKIWEEMRGVQGWDCGCIDVTVECCKDAEIAWDEDASADTVARNDSCTVAITDSLGDGGPYDWAVSGTGFTLDNAQTAGLSNTLNADGTACGTATIIVTGGDCGVVVATGYVRCTTGGWTYKGQVGALAVTKCEIAIGNIKYEDQWCSMCPVDYGKCGELCGPGEEAHTSSGCGSHPVCPGEEEWCYVVGYKWWEWECP